MKETLEKLWNEYLLDDCAEIDTDGERDLTKKTAELHEKVNALLSLTGIEPICLGTINPQGFVRPLS